MCRAGFHGNGVTCDRLISADHDKERRRQPKHDDLGASEVIGTLYLYTISFLYILYVVSLNILLHMRGSFSVKVADYRRVFCGSTIDVFFWII